MWRLGSEDLMLRWLDRWVIGGEAGLDCGRPRDKKGTCGGRKEKRVERKGGGRGEDRREGGIRRVVVEVLV